jgi:PAS domain S-box-containing protein
VESDKERERDKLYAGVLDHLPWGVCVVDSQGRILLLNRFQERLSAVKRTEVLGRCLFDSPSVRASGLDQVVRQVLSTGTPWRGQPIEVPLQAPDGETVQAFRDEVVPLRSNDKVVGALILSIPVNEELRLWRERHQAYSHLQAVLDSLPAPVMVIDADFQIVRASSAYARLFAVESHEGLVGQRCYVVLRGRRAVCEDCPVPEARRSGKWVRAELNTPQQQGGGATVAVSALPLPGGKGETLLLAEGLAVEGRPGPELPTAQKDLLRKEIARQVAQMRVRAAYAEGVLNTIEELVAVLSTEGKVLFCNRALAASAEQSADKLVGSALSNLGGEIPWDRLETEFRKALGADNTVRGRLSWRSPDKGECHLDYEFQAQVLADGTRVVALCARDVSEMVRARARQVFQEKMDSLAQLAGRIAHEINNPLEALQNHVSLLEIEIAKGADVAGVRAELEAIQKQIRQIANVTSLLVGFTRGSPEEYAPVDLATVLRNAAAVSEITRSPADLTVETDIRPDLPKILGSESDLERCFVNILRNAAEAIVDKGVIRIAARHNPYSGQVEVEVSDTGVGIPEHILPHVFEPFFTTKKVSRQAGLGLSLCYGIVSDHGGHIEVRSQPGRGATVIVSLPAMVMEPQSIGARA